MDPTAQRGLSGSLPSAPPLTLNELDVLIRVQTAVSTCRVQEDLLERVAGALGDALPAGWIVLAVTGSPDFVVTAGSLRGAPALAPDALPLTRVFAQCRAGRRTLVFPSLDEIRASFPVLMQSLSAAGVGSLVVLPLRVDDRDLGVLAFMAVERAPESGSLGLMSAVADSVAHALDNCLAYGMVQGMGRELKALLDLNLHVGRHLERDELFGALAECISDLLEIDRFGIELPIEGDRLQGHLLTPNREHPQPTRVKILPAAGTACNWVLQYRRWLVTSTREELREQFPLTFEVMSNEGMESLCAMPLVVEGRARGVMFFMGARKAAYRDLRRGLFDQVAAAAAVALDNCLAYEEVRRLRDRLAEENVYLQDEVRSRHNPDEFVCHSPALEAVLTKVACAAATDSTVLISGETGTGKELVARILHAQSHRRQRPLIKVNCATLPAGLVESELFGHEKGAFTGALNKRAGRFELASGGTIFLDEVGEMPLETQTKLLRVLQEREFERVGGSAPIKVDVRVIAATNRDLLKAVEDGSFRRDLYHRLNVVPIHLPPLRERRAEIPLLAGHLVDRIARRIGRKVSAISPESLDLLTSCAWPGNVRELENVIERAMVYSSGETLEIPPEFLSLPARPVVTRRAPAPQSDLESIERAHILSVLSSASWVIDGPSGAAGVLGLHPNTLRSRLKKLGIKRPAHAAS